METGSGRLQALDPATGRPVIPAVSGGPAMHFVTPGAGGGRVYAVLDHRPIAVVMA